MLKPKGIEVYSQSIGTSEVGTPKDKHVNNNTMKGLFEVTPTVPQAVELRQTSINVSTVDENNNRSAVALDGAEKNQLMQTPQFNDTDVLIKTFKGVSPRASIKQTGPFLNLHNVDEMKSGEIATAKLASSNSERDTVEKEPGVVANSL